MGKRAPSITFVKPTVTKPKVIELESVEPEVKIEEKRPSQFESPVSTIQQDQSALHRAEASQAKSAMKYPPRYISFALVFLLLLATGAATYTFKLYQDSQSQVKNLKNPQDISKAEVQMLVDTVGKLIDLPKETPTVATVTDEKKLKNQAFFAKAVNGDKVLIYTQAKKAILYSTKLNKILEVAPINIGENKDTSVAGESTTASSSPTLAPKPTQ